MRIVDNNLDLTEDYYFIGKESVNKGLEYAKKMPDIKYEKLNFFAYWIGKDFSYKHATVIKSFLATQDINKCKFYIYCDVDASQNEFIKPYLSLDCVEFKIFNVEEEVKGTVLENNKTTISLIKNHNLNPALESDFFRILMLYKYGGIYIDFDVLLLRNFSPLLRKEFMYQWENWPSINWINGAIMYVEKQSKLANDLINELNKTPANRDSLCWASDLYCKVREYNNDWVVYPASMFNSEWQYGQPINSFGIYYLSNELFDGAFTWHWHNRWRESIQEGSKFNRLDNIIKEKLKNKNLNIC